MAEKKLETKHSTSKPSLPKTLYDEFHTALQDRDLEQLKDITDSHDISSWMPHKTSNALTEVLNTTDKAFKKAVNPHLSLSRNNIDPAEFTAIIRELFKNCDQETLFIHIIYESKIKIFKQAVQEYRLKHRKDLTSETQKILNYLETILEIIVPMYQQELRRTQKIIEALCDSSSINNFVKAYNPLLTAMEFRNLDFIRMLLQQQIPIDSDSNNQISAINYLINMLVTSDSELTFEKNRNFVFKVFEEFSKFGIDANYALHQAIILCNYHLTQHQISCLTIDNPKTEGIYTSEKLSTELEKFAHSLSQLIKHTCKFWHQPVEEEKQNPTSIGKSNYSGVPAITNLRYKKLTGLDFVVSSNFGIVVEDDEIAYNSDDDVVLRIS